jgi:8-oxo-dGTP pyrophosphatase MutT (NUDIX family)
MSLTMSSEDYEYFDAWGNIHSPGPGQEVSKRNGVFAALVVNNHILLTWPSHRKDCVPELPGGGIDDGEELREALIREVVEETTVRITDLDPVNEFRQQIGFYSDKNAEFWDYEQTYWLIEGDGLEALYSQEIYKPEDASVARWVSLEELGNMKIHAAHRAALKFFKLTD